VKNWMEGAWKATEPHIAAIWKTCVSTLKSIEGTISFEWVKGHSGNDGNTCADKLAGCHDEIDTFADLVKLLGQVGNSNANLT
jgi:ribonuclease HI